MSYAVHVGRIGALAVALGVGSAIAFPHVAWADEGSAGADTAAQAGAPADTAAAPASTPAADSTPATDPAPAAKEDADKDDGSTSVSVGDSPPVTISAQTVEATSPKKHEDSTPEPTHESHDAHDASPDAVDVHRQSPEHQATTAATEPDPAPTPHHTAAARTATVAAAPVTASPGTTPTPTASVAVTTVTPPQAPPPLAPVRALVLGVLGVFGFTPNPAPGTVNNPILEVLWGAYRRIESTIGNGPPTAGTAGVVGTSLTTDGKVAVTLTMGFTDPEGAPLTYTTTGGAKGSLTANTDGTYTYLTDAGSVGTDTVAITATDTGFHLDSLFGVSHSRTATLTIALTAATNAAPVIDSVTSTPGIGNTWTVAVTAHDPDGATVTTGLSAADPAHATITDEGGGTYTVSVTDAAWALAHPGTQITVTATASDGAGAPATRTVAIGTVGNVVGAGVDYYGLTSAIPALPAGVTYTQVSAGAFSLALLRSDSQIVIVAPDSTTAIPAPLDGLTYTQITTGIYHTVYLRSDGQVFGTGDDSYGQIDIPPLPDGLTYTAVAAGDLDTVLLRSDGQAVAFGYHNFATDVPELPPGLTYTQVAAAFSHTVFLRSDGTVVAVGRVYNEDPNAPLGGWYEDAESTIPPPPLGVTYTGVAGGRDFTVLLRSDGQAVGIGQRFAATGIPALPTGLVYTQIAAGYNRIALIRSDGGAVTLSDTVPTLPDDVAYIGADAGGDFVALLTTLDTSRPVTTADSVTTAEDTPLVIAPNMLLGNDTDPGGATLTISAASQGSHGTTVVGADGTITYTPAADFNGTDTFTYAVTNGTATRLGTVTVTVTAVNDAPAFSVTPGTRNTWTVTSHDVDGDPLTTSVTAADPTHVTVTDNGGGSYTVSVTDADWALAHPGTQILVTTTASDGIAAPLSTTASIGTVSNLVMIGLDWPIPALAPGITYTHVAPGAGHIVLIRSDGTAVGVDFLDNGNSDIPALPDGLTYTAVAAGSAHTVLLRSDGTAVGIGRIGARIDIPDLPPGTTYTQIAAGDNHTVLLRSDGTVIGIGENFQGEIGIPDPPPGTRYTAVATGVGNTVLVRSDGTAVAVGDNRYGQTAIPELPDGMTYTDIAAGYGHIVLLRSDGTVVAVGDGSYGKTTIPELPDGMTYIRVAAGIDHTVLMRSDGAVVTVGRASGAPNPPAGVTYTEIRAGYDLTVLLTAVVSERPT